MFLLLKINVLPITRLIIAMESLSIGHNVFKPTEGRVDLGKTRKALQNIQVMFLLNVFFRNLQGRFSEPSHISINITKR